jgi:type VI secretion system protein ImpF
MPSLLDRLLDPEAMGTAARPGYTVQEMFTAVRADLEDLLNTRLTVTDLPPEFVETHDSIVSYGLPDLVSLEAITPQQRADIGRVIEGIVQRFEPRLRQIRATLVGGADLKERSVRFHIDARLNLDPAPEVAFETILELTTGHATVLSTESRS